MGFKIRHSRTLKVRIALTIEVQYKWCRLVYSNLKVCRIAIPNHAPSKYRKFWQQKYRAKEKEIGDREGRINNFPCSTDNYSGFQVAVNGAEGVKGGSYCNSQLYNLLSGVG
jgi:hypothetical protein